MRILRLTSLVLAIICLMGCYTFTGSTLPGHLKTININPVVDETLNPVFAEDLTRGIIQGIESGSSLRHVNHSPHCELVVRLKSYSHQAQNTSGSDVTDYRVDVVAEVQFYDRVKFKKLFEEKNLPGYGTYSVTTGQTETDGQAAAIQNLVDNIISNTISGW